MKRTSLRARTALALGLCIPLTVATSTVGAAAAAGSPAAGSPAAGSPAQASPAQASPAQASPAQASPAVGHGHRLIPRQVYRPSGRQRVMRFAVSHRLPLIDIWAIQRDNGGCPGKIDSNSCSGIKQPGWAFSHLLEGFTK